MQELFNVEHNGQSGNLQTSIIKQSLKSCYADADTWAVSDPSVNFPVPMQEDEGTRSFWRYAFEVNYRLNPAIHQPLQRLYPLQSLRETFPLQLPGNSKIIIQKSQNQQLFLPEYSFTTKIDYRRLYEYLYREMRQSNGTNKEATVQRVVSVLVDTFMSNTGHSITLPFK